MKHWHLCERWRKAGFDAPCPLTAFAEHEEEEDDDDLPDEITAPGKAKPRIEDPGIFAERKASTGAGTKQKTLEEVINEILINARSQAVIKALGQGVPVVPTGIPQPPTARAVNPGGLPSEKPHFEGGGPGTGIPAPARVPTAAAAALNVLVADAGPQTSPTRTADAAEQAITETINRFVSARSGIQANELAQIAAVLSVAGAGAVAGGGFFFNAGARMKALLSRAPGDFKLAPDEEGPNSEEEFFQGGFPG